MPKMRMRALFLFATPNAMRICVGTTLALLLPGCAMMTNASDQSNVTAGGVNPTLEQMGIGSTYDAQEQFLRVLFKTAGLPDTDMLPLKTRDPDWSLVWKAGVYEIGRQCDQYLDILFRFNRLNRARQQGIAAAAATTGSIMGLTGSAATPIAVVAAAFGLTTSLFDAAANSVLFTIEPSALRNVALQGRQNYLESFKKATFDNRPDTLIALQGYLAQCSPAAIEANINLAANGAASVASPTGTTASAAALLAAPAHTLLLDKAGKILDQDVQIIPPKIPQDEKAFNLTPNENQRLKKSDIAKLQGVLGVLIDGDIGPKGSTTRLAIEEFQLGMKARDSTWMEGQKLGELTGKTLNLLLTLKPMPLVFRSPFERALLGDNLQYMLLDLQRLKKVLQVLGQPQGSSIEKMRDANKGKALDSQFYKPLQDKFDAANG